MEPAQRVLVDPALAGSEFRDAWAAEVARLESESARLAEAAFSPGVAYREATALLPYDGVPIDFESWARPPFRHTPS